MQGDGMGDILGQLSDFASYLFSWSGAWIWLALFLVIAIYLYVRPHPFWLNDLIYRFPLVGKLARYSTDPAEEVPGGWLNVELTLCADYARYVTSLSRREFDNHIEYLRKAHEIGRRPLPAWGWMLVTALVAFEGLAFAYILGSWISIDSSENQRLLFMLAIVSVLAILLVSLTHKAGHQLYRTKLLQACRRALKEKRGPHFFSRPIALSEKQSIDDSEPPYVQCTNRIVTRHDDYGGRFWIWSATLFVLIIAIGATWLRIATLDSANNTELLQDIFGGLEGGAAEPSAMSNRTAAFISFGMLAVIFVITQVVAVGLGYNYGFAGRESLAAYTQTGGHPNYESYWRQIQHRMNIANSRLQSLQRLMEEASVPISWQYNFFDYIRREKDNRNLRLPPEPDNPSDEPSNQQSHGGDGEDDGTNVTRLDRSGK
jgi:hypothetical protein